MADTKAIIRALAGPLEAEKRRGYRDTAIIGLSLGEYVQNWAETAREAFGGPAAGATGGGRRKSRSRGRGRRSKPAPAAFQAPHDPLGLQVVGKVLEALRDYGKLDAEEREERVRQARKLLVELLTGAAKAAPEQTAPARKASAKRGCGTEARAQKKKPPPPKQEKRRTSPAARPGRKESRASTALLDQPVAAQRRPAPAWMKKLGNLGIATNRDLLHHFPRAYLPLRRLSEVKDGERAAVLVRAGERAQSVLREGRGFRLMQYTLDVEDDTGAARVASVARVPRWGARAQTIANSPLALNYRPGTRLLLEGSVRRLGRLVEIQYTGSERITDGEDLAVGSLVPIYPLTEGVYQGQVRGAVRRLLDQLPPELQDPLPASLRREYRLPSLSQALREIHWPSSEKAKDEARRRLAFEELLVLELAMAQRKRERQRPATGLAMPPQGDVIAALAEALPFTLTRAQQRVIAEITADMASDTPMYRLLQGDVGSGKTVVAAAALVIAAQNGYQAALMAPTEILAEQHYLVLTRLLQPLGIRILLLTGSMRAREKDQALRALRAGDPVVAVGTHALIQQRVDFGKLGLVIVDEQHRFGVRQRADLASKAAKSGRKAAPIPHMLIMTATPIPRSLALTLYGDLDLSVLDEMPPGRQQVRTLWFKLASSQDGAAAAPEACDLVRRQLAEGRQAYVVCPLIEESEELQAQAATKLSEELQRGEFSDFRVGLVHGAMRVADREVVMDAFRSGELDVLTATTVIEVGVDIPNATVMMIVNAERFGLAQLHQLRGRVGRGAHQSYCLLLTPAKYDPTGRLAPGAEESLGLARDRLRVMLETNDGFAIAEKDLELRGPGELYGSRQHGLPDFRLARLAGDLGVLATAREAAFQLVEKDPDLRAGAHRALRAQVRQLRDRMERPAG